MGGAQIDEAVAQTFLATVTPAGIEAALGAEAALEQEHDAAVTQWRLAVERARYAADRAERRYRAVEPEHRLVARGLEAEWEQRLRDRTATETELARRETYKEGSVPLHTLRANIDYGAVSAHTVAGKVGIKVWICVKPEQEPDVKAGVPHAGNA